MSQLLEALQEFLDGLEFGPFPTVDRIVDSMDPVAWTLVLLLGGAVMLGIFFTLSTRRTFLVQDEIEATPSMLLERLKQDPTQIPPLSIVSRLGAEATLELLDYGDQIQTNEWRYRWAGVREELLHQLSQQNAFGPTYALARYYRCSDVQEPDTLRIRRTALVHKLGVRRHLEPNSDGKAPQLRIRCHPAEVEGDLGFDGETFWLMPEEPAPTLEGPLIEMEPIEFRTLNQAQVRMHIRRTPMVGGGFRLELRKRRKMWVIVDEEIEWVS